ncbi:MAG: LCCL domain-containing protein [Pirellulaceae bacterium]|nr:hypothetical protein [Planctomycetales bacterium]
MNYFCIRKHYDVCLRFSHLTLVLAVGLYCEREAMGQGMPSPLAAKGGVTAESAEDRFVPTIAWDTTLRQFQFDADKFLGQRLTVKCPAMPAGQSLDGLFGTDRYPSDSVICVAAMHAGKIDSRGGIVTVQLNPGEKAYGGSSRNGVQSRDRPETRRSIAFVDESAVAAVDTDRAALLPEITWETKFTSTGFAYRDFIGQRFSFRCPPAPQDLKGRIIYGTDAYDFASLICPAAVHAGKLTTAGGIVTVQIDAGVPKLDGSIRNGFETRSKGKVDRSISFVADDTDASHGK